MYCPFCGTQIPDEAVFCGACGKQVGQIPPPEPADKKHYVRAQDLTPAKRTSLFGIFALIAALLYPAFDLFWRMALYRLIVGEPRFMIRVFLGIFRYNLILAVLGMTGMILIAIYLLALYPKRKGAALAGIGAILVAVSKIIFIRSTVSYMLSSAIVLAGAILLAVYWFSNEHAFALGIIGPALCIAGTCFYQIVDFLTNGIAIGQILFWAGMLMDFAYVIFWVIVLIANIAGKMKKA